ncbi:hypothetical protein BJ546DRAFT_837702 [Cryomyces antarcticus]
MESLRPLIRASASAPRILRHRQYAPLQCLHTTTPKPATPLPHPTAPGPPPKAPLPSVTQPEDRVARKRKQAELLQRGQALRADPAKPGAALQKRFWKDVSVKETPGMGLQVHLDSRPVRTGGRNVLTLPPSKRPLATAIALEWDHLISAQQALKQHYVPLTSLTSRAIDIKNADAQNNRKIRDEMVQSLMRYLATDTLLCWAPEKNIHQGLEGSDIRETGGKSLRQRQIEAAKPILDHLTTHVWPGVEVVPILGEESIMPKPQPEMTRETVKGWISGLPPWELAGLERAVLASKSLCVAARLVVEWSEEFANTRQAVGEKNRRFGIVDAAEAASVEVRWQTGMWGEVEDTHDVEKEDMRRQLGSVVLLVSGM